MTIYNTQRSVLYNLSFSVIIYCFIGYYSLLISITPSHSNFIYSSNSFIRSVRIYSSLSNCRPLSGLVSMA